MELFLQAGGRRAMALALCVLACCVVAAAEEENLLSNAGFEQYDNGLPVDWSLFVLPQEGATGSLDRNGRAVQGRNAVLLSTETPYATDPFNNWSQNVVRDFTGKLLIVKGAIRTEEATDASLWVQCWRKDPWSMLASSGTGTATPVTGTKDWTRVEVRLKAPRGTEYVTVRCVLKGTGKAWFDDLSLTTEIAAPSPAASLSLPKPPPAAALPAQPPPTETPMPNVDANAMTMSSLMGLLSGDTEQAEATPSLRIPSLPIPPAPPARSAAQPRRPEAPTVENKSVQELVNANRMLMESYQALQQTNAELGEQVKSQQKEIQNLRRQQRQGRTAPKPAPEPAAEVAAPAPEEAAPEAEPPAAEEPAPPLVPSTTENNG